MSKLEEIRRGTMRLKQRERERLNRKYNTEEKSTLYVTTMLKQKIRASGRKIKRYDVYSSSKTGYFRLIKGCFMEHWMERNMKKQVFLTQMK